MLELYRKLTNPSRHFDPIELAAFAARNGGQVSALASQFTDEHPELLAPDPTCRAGFSWLPPSDSPERKLVAARYCADEPPDNLLEALIEAIQSGEIDLTPSADSGWYDWQLHALETLLVPERGAESDHLLLTQEYKDKLVETFKSILIQTRETHVKQLEGVAILGSTPPQPVDVYPLLPVEPFPTFYLRTARAYAFLGNVLSATIGSAMLDTTARLLEDGSRHQLSLAEELTEKAQLLYGLHLIAAASIGLADQMTDDERAAYDSAAAQAAARQWLEGWRQDRDVLVDPRVAVPLVRDEEQRIARNLGVVGIKVIRMHASFPRGYQPRLVSGCKIREFVPFEPYLLVEQTLEFTTDVARPPLTREQFRAILDEHGSLEAIREALEQP